MRCPSCGVHGSLAWSVVPCPDPDEPGETLEFMVCANCDYGINEHTEGVCTCDA